MLFCVHLLSKASRRYKTLQWMRRVKRELMAYTSLKVRREHLIERLATMDDNIHPRQSKVDDMPKARGGLPKSSVEFTAIKREEELREIRSELGWVEKQLEPMERGLNALNEIDREVIRLSYYSFDVPDDQIASSLGLSNREYEDIKFTALCTIDIYTMKPRNIVV